MKLNKIVLAILVACVVGVTSCNTYNSTYSKSKALLFSLTQQSSSSSTIIQRQIFGNVKVLDGCNFQVSNFTLIPSGLNVYFYAVPSTPPTDQQPPYLARIVATALGAYNGQTITFTLQPDYNWSDFAVVMIWSEQERKAFGAFGVTQQVKDVFKLPSDNGANLQLDPNADSASRQHRIVTWQLWITFFTLLVIFQYTM